MEREYHNPNDAASLETDAALWLGFFEPQDDKTQADLLSLVNGYLSCTAGERERVRTVLTWVTASSGAVKAAKTLQARKVFHAATQGGREDLARALDMSLEEFEAAIA